MLFYIVVFYVFKIQYIRSVHIVQNPYGIAYNNILWFSNSRHRLSFISMKIINNVVFQIYFKRLYQT